jgi:hypothetical protein
MYKKAVLIAISIPPKIAPAANPPGHPCLPQQGQVGNIVKTAAIISHQRSIEDFNKATIFFIYTFSHPNSKLATP